MTSPAYERLTLNITERSARAAELAAETTGLSKTDCWNQAIQMYNYLQHEIAAGQDLYLKNPDTGQMFKLSFASGEETGA